MLIYILIRTWATCLCCYGNVSFVLGFHSHYNNAFALIVCRQQKTLVADRP